MPTTPLVRRLTVLAAVMAVGEVISSIVIWREAYPDSQPLFALAFAALYALAAGLLRARRVVAGAVLTGLLCLFEVATSPTWQRFTALDWITQILFGGIALIGVFLAATVLVTRLRSGRTRTGAAAR
jgi:hypothetical protein